VSVILVSGAAQNSGATTVAVGLAHRLAYAGHRVRVERLSGDERAPLDAETFGLLEFATSSGVPVDPASITGGNETTILEAPVGADVAALARQLHASLVVVGRAGEPAPHEGLAIATHARDAGPLAIPEDRLLAAPHVGAIIEASGARVLARSLEGDREICEHIVLGPVSSDPNDSHFDRFERKAVITRAEKVDIALAALKSGVRCLVLSGGADPSPYLLDRVSADRHTTLLLAPEGTVETARDIEEVFGASPFFGEEKVERIGQLMALAIDDSALASLTV